MKGDGTIYEHAGSYSELLEKIKTAPQSVVKAKPQCNKPNAANSSNTKARKLSYNQQRLLEVLPGEIEQLEKDIQSLSAELSNPNLYQNDPDRFDEASKLLEIKQQEKASKEEQWLEISLLADELES
jgi:ATP-binding cassette subfamily F protein uup